MSGLKSESDKNILAIFWLAGVIVRALPAAPGRVRKLLRQVPFIIVGQRIGRQGSYEVIHTGLRKGNLDGGFLFLTGFDFDFAVEFALAVDRKGQPGLAGPRRTSWLP